MGAMELDDFPTGELMRLSPLVGRVLAPNPSPFTYTGTQTYVVGQAELAVIDPGPDHPSHLEALLRVVAGRPLKRSEERRVGKGCVSTCRSRWRPYHKKKKKQ